MGICVRPFFPESSRRELVTSLVEAAEEITLSMPPLQPSNLSNFHPKWDVFIKPIPLKAQDASEEEVGRREESEMTNDTKETVSSGNNSINTNSQRLYSMNKAYICSRQVEYQHQEGQADTKSHP